MPVGVERESPEVGIGGCLGEGPEAHMADGFVVRGAVLDVDVDPHAPAVGPLPTASCSPRVNDVFRQHTTRHRERDE